MELVAFSGNDLTSAALADWFRQAAFAACRARVPRALPEPAAAHMNAR
jgi:hypothetical protein